MHLNSVLRRLYIKSYLLLKVVVLWDYSLFLFDGVNPMITPSGNIYFFIFDPSNEFQQSIDIFQIYLYFY